MEREKTNREMANSNPCPLMASEAQTLSHADEPKSTMLRGSGILVDARCLKQEKYYAMLTMERLECPYRYQTILQDKRAINWSTLYH